eukprot:1018912-Prymnesium_polylepis.1
MQPRVRLGLVPRRRREDVIRARGKGEALLHLDEVRARIEGDGARRGPRHVRQHVAVGDVVRRRRAQRRETPHQL